MGALGERDGGRRSAGFAAAWSIVPGIVLAGVGGGIVYPILPLASVQVGLSPAFIGFILASNRLSRMGCDPFIGNWVDRFGGRRMIIWGLLVEVLVMGTYVAAIPSGNAGLMFLIGRMVWGPAAGLVFISGQTLALHAACPAERGRVAGMVRTAQISGQPLGMVIGGVLAGLWGDEAAFGAGVVAAAFGAVYAWRTIPDLSAPTAHAFRWREVVRTFARPFELAVSTLNLAGFFAVQGLLLATLVLMLDERRLTVYGWPPQTMAGLSLALLLVAATVATPIVGRLTDRARRRALIVLPGALLLAAGFVVLARAADPARLAVALLLIGAGMGCFNVPLLAMLGDHVPAEIRGTAVAGLQIFGDVGGTLGPVAGTAALAAWGVTLPYLGTAAFVLCVALPVAFWVLRAEGRLAAARRPGGSDGAT